MNLVTRSQWGARAARSSTPLRASVQKGLAFHWEGPRMGAFSHDKCAGKVKSIQNFHMDSRGWADIAYNFIVCPHGYVFEGRGWGRRSAANGTNSCNDVYTAVCYLGGQGDSFTAEAKVAFLDVKAEWERRYGRKAQAVPHSNCVATMCPGDEIRRWMLAGMPRPGGEAPAPGPTPPPPSPTPPEPSIFEVDMTVATVDITFVTDGSGSGWVRIPHQIDKIIGVLPPGMRPGVDNRYQTGEVGLAQEDPNTIVSITGWDANSPCVIRLRVAV